MIDSRPESVPEAPLSVGAKLDRYELARRIATGGMGTVWLARLTGKHGFEKPVAVKTILPELSAIASFRAMFLEEARVASKLAHPHVAQVLDVGEARGILYIVFEWVDGAPLGQLCAAAEASGRAVPLGFVLGALADVCAGLHAAHELGVVHRDVGPQNVLVASDGFAKLIDFGIAKAHDRLCAETKSGLVRGTPEYMSPEQASGAPLDRRTDLWSVGAVLHRAMFCRPPFRNQEELVELIQGKRTVEVPPETPADVRSILVRSLARSRDERYATADEMRAALRQAAHSHADRAPAASFVQDVLGARAEKRPAQAATLPERPGAPAMRDVDAREDAEAASVSLLPRTPRRERPPARPEEERDAWRLPLRIALVLAALAAVAALAFALATPSS